MLWRDIGYLIKETEKLDKFRKPYSETTRRLVYCNKKSIRQSEFYQAQAQGFKPELMFEIRSEEYRGEEYLDFNKKRYRILRTYDRNGELTELVCTSLVVENSQSGS